MSTRPWLKTAFFAASISLTIVAGCDYDNHATATGKVVQPPETKSVTDPGKLNAGGPGAQGQTPK